MWFSDIDTEAAVASLIISISGSTGGRGHGSTRVPRATIIKWEASVENLQMVEIILKVAVAFCLLIVIHELGHFLVAKYLGIGVERFSIGFGPKIAELPPGRDRVHVVGDSPGRLRQAHRR